MSSNLKSGVLQITPTALLPCAEVWFTYSRSAGPGGQNVNKVSTKATLHWAVDANKTLPAGIRQRFVQQFANRINADGILLISSDRFRSQLRNANDCFERLQEMLQSVARPPRRRRATKPSRGAVQRRLNDKRHNAQRKQERRESRRPDHS